MDPAFPEQPWRVAIAGSCVSRDTVEHLGQSRVSVQCYVARQSWLSWGSNASAWMAPDVSFTSSFQRAQVMGDARGDLTARLHRHAESVDLLLVDLCDERHGVIRFADGAHITRSVDLMGHAELKLLADRGRTVTLGDDNHFIQWQHAADRFAGWLGAVGLRDRTLVLNPQWAERCADGTPTPSSMGLSAADANERYARYVHHLAQLGLPIVTSIAPEADTAHRWGAAPFHYAPQVYDELGQQLLQFATECGRRNA